MENEFEEILVNAEDLKTRDILIIDGGRYTSEVCIVNIVVKVSGTIVRVLSKGMSGGADEFKYKLNQQVQIARRIKK